MPADDYVYVFEAGNLVNNSSRIIGVYSHKSKALRSVNNLIAVNGVTWRRIDPTGSFWVRDDTQDFISVAPRIVT